VEGVVTELDPPRVFAFTQDPSAVLPREGNNHLRFELRPDGDGCLLVFTHAFHDRPHAAANAAGWHACFDALEMVVDGRPMELSASFVGRHEAYIEAFGLNRGSAETTPGGWRVRFERQLMQQPVDKVWATLDAAGARIVLTQTGPSELPGQRSTALAAWQAHLDRLARRLQETG
jgi:hypothetical protein